MGSIEVNSKKCRRKILRCLDSLKKDTGIVEAHYPCKNLFIGNAGLTTGLDEESVVELFSVYGSLENLVLVPGKQYSFVCFRNIENAKLAYEKIHGVVGTKGNRFPLYLAYVEEVPDIRKGVEYKMPPGLKVVEDFISVTEEQELLHMINWECQPLESSLGQTLKHRQVRHFGYEFKYGSNLVNVKEPLSEGIPTRLSPVLDRLVVEGYMRDRPDQLTVNFYTPGQGIPPHIDTISCFTGEIISLSTGSGVLMDFRHRDGKHCAVYLPPRSLCVMTGPSRYEWTHGISPRMTDVVPVENGSGLTLKQRGSRLSFTFRKTQEVDTKLPDYKLRINEHQKSRTSMNELQSMPADNKAAFALETEHVLQVYDNIAHHFSQTRHKPWPQVLQFVNLLNPGSRLLDIGCGNGKYLGHNRNIIEVGCDSSVKLCEICIRRGFSVVQCNCLNLPFSDESFTAVICIAVIHHLSTPERRKAAIMEMARVLTVGGQALVYVWALEQQWHKNKSAYLKQNKKNRTGRNKDTGEDDECFGPQCGETQVPQEDIVDVLPQELKSDHNETDVKIPTVNLPIHENRTGFTHQDMLVPWKLKPQKGSGDSRERDFQDKVADEINRESERNKEENVISKDASKVDVGVVNRDDPPVFHRYYHLFREGELESICTSLSCIQIVKSYHDEGNWCVIFKKFRSKNDK